MYNDNDKNKDQLKPSEVELLEQVHGLAQQKTKNYTKQDALDRTDVLKGKLQRVLRKARRTRNGTLVLFTNFIDYNKKTDQYFAVSLQKMKPGALVSTLMHERKTMMGQIKSWSLFLQHPVVNEKIPGLGAYHQASQRQQQMMEIMCDSTAPEFKRGQAEVEYTKATRQMARIAKQNPDVRALDLVVA